MSKHSSKTKNSPSNKKGRFPSAAPKAPPGTDLKRLFDGIYWFQNWEVFEGVFTPGKNSISNLCSRLHLPEDLTGRRVLDIGAWNGCLSFECERRNALEVVALGPDNPEATGFRRLQREIGSTRTRWVTGSVYDLNPKKLGYFDLILFCGVLYHLRYPLLAIDNIRRVAVGEVYTETVVIDKRGVNHPELPLWLFYKDGQLENDESNWFGPNSLAVAQAFQSAGFDIELLTCAGRGTFRASVRPNLPDFLTQATLENLFYRELMSPLLRSHPIKDWLQNQVQSPFLSARGRDGST